MVMFYVQQKQKWAETTLKTLYRKKQELKFERAAVEQQRERFKRMEREYDEFVVERKRLKKEKQLHLREQKKLTAVASNQMKEFREMKRRMAMYRDKIESLENQNKVSPRCLTVEVTLA